MELYPAIDIRDGKCVRLHQGDYGQETVYGLDPCAQAKAFEQAGAGWIHVVDLDAARSGTAVNRDVVGSICAAVDVPVQAGGGVRSIESARALLALGVERIVVGTAALQQPDMVGSLAAECRVAVGLDSRSGDLATDGWLVASGRTVLAVARSFADAGVDAFVVTDIARDGTLQGPDLEGLAEMLEATPVDVIASGGVGSSADLSALAALEAGGRRLAGAIVGKAIYEGRVNVADAVTQLTRAS